MKRSLLYLAISMVWACSAFGATFSITVTLDENGNGVITNTNGFSSALPSMLAADPGPGGKSSALTYGLLNPPGLTVGDLKLFEPGGGTLSDVIRFNASSPFANQTGSLVFYSLADGDLDLADTGLPSAFYTNVATGIEVGDGFSYTPTIGQPGFVANAGGPVTYNFTSPAATPEPSTMALLGTVLAFLTMKKLRADRRAA